MAYITQYEIDRDRQNRFNQGLNVAVQGLEGIEENRRRAVDAKRAQEKIGRENELLGIQKENAQMDRQQKAYGIEQLKKPLEERDDYRQQLAKHKASEEAYYNRFGVQEGAKVKSEERAVERKQDEEKRALTNSGVKKIAEDNIKLLNVKNSIDEAITKFDDPNTPDDEKVKIGQGLYKTLNSPDGADAVGAEEAKRVGSYLEYHMGNITQPGAFVGRDLGGFRKQIGNFSEMLGGRVKRNEQTSTGIQQGKSFTELAQPQQLAPSEDEAAIQWAKQNAQDPRAQAILKIHGAK
jgi:hypothetical protein